MPTCIHEYVLEQFSIISRTPWNTGLNLVNGSSILWIRCSTGFLLEHAFAWCFSFCLTFCCRGFLLGHAFAWCFLFCRTFSFCFSFGFCAYNRRFITDRHAFRPCFSWHTLMFKVWKPIVLDALPSHSYNLLTQWPHGIEPIYFFTSSTQKCIQPPHSHRYFCLVLCWPSFLACNRIPGSLHGWEH